MADNVDKFGIEIDLSVSGLQTELIKAQNELRKFQTQLKSSTDTTEIAKLTSSITVLDEKIAHLGNRMGDMKKPSADATNALGNLSRVAQDAPYGFMGVANNINPLLESFQRLSKESGGVGNALKSMAAGLMGPAGIGLAVGALSSLIVAFGDDIGDMLSDVTETDKAMAQMRDAFEQNLKSVGSTIASDQALLVVINDVTQSTNARKAALNQLKENHKGYDELQKATITDTDALRLMTDRLSDALVRKAKIEATAQVIGEEFAKLMRLQTASIGEQINNLNFFEKGYATWKATFSSLNFETVKFNAVQNATAPAIEKNKEQINSITQALTNLDKEYKKLTSESFQAGDFDVTGAASPKKQAKAKQKVDIDTSELDLLKKKQQLYKDDVYAYKEYADLITQEEEKIALKKAKINKASASEIQNIKDQAAIGLQQNAINLGNSLDKIFKAADDKYIKDQKEFEKEKLANQLIASKDSLDIVKNTLDVETKLAGDSYEKRKEALQKAMAETKILMALSSNPKAVQELDKAYKDMDKQYKLLDIDQKQKDTKKLQDNYKKFADTIANDVTQGFMVMFDAMSKGENPLQALGNYLGDLVKQFAAAIIQATIFKGIMSLLNLATGGGTGFLGGILGGVGKLLGMAEGGVVSQPTLAMVGEGGQSEAVMPLNKLSNMLGSTFNAGAMSGAGAGSGNGQFVLKGNDLVLALQRSNYSLNLRRGNGI